MPEISYRFTKSEQRYLDRTEKERIKIRRKIAVRQKRLDAVLEEIKELRTMDRNLYHRRYPIIERLQKRCKHTGPKGTDTKYRDFGPDIVRTWCLDCGTIIASRDCDCQ